MNWRNLLFKTIKWIIFLRLNFFLFFVIQKLFIQQFLLLFSSFFIQFFLNLFFNFNFKFFSFIFS